ncbi:hypothetical protein BN938_2472 [Mucinivorans hirudinis]|uniref:Uncharacterized protein n=1 Tax=Mucinivorans hirudinis TaxID=1433126 RepID=A0A060RAC5_9BACT|nr:hypothetical protein BN938_0670 [Mucinivorans hirudinis]CDN32542.1 hypothetical protein BN938_2472 [Mucinivorans hirudinis]
MRLSITQINLVLHSAFTIFVIAVRVIDMINYKNYLSLH